MNLAYLILVHRNPRLLERVIQALCSDQSSFFVHIDRKADLEEFSNIRRRNVFLCEPRLPVYWGEFSQVDATLRLLRQALNSSIAHDYLVFMQGSDYPLRSSSYIQRFFEKHKGSEFISLVSMPAPGYPFSKIDKVRYPSDKPVRRFASRALAKLHLAHRDHRKYLRDLRPYAGDACWALSRDACKYIVDFAERNRHLERYFRNTLTSDEVFFHTIIGNSPYRTRVRRNLFYRDWSIPGDHPVMLNEGHIKFFEENTAVWVEDQFGSGEALFARKFSDEKIELVERIDKMIERKEESRAAARLQGDTKAR
jgi:hypothetical protein